MFLCVRGQIGKELEGVGGGHVTLELETRFSVCGTLSTLHTVAHLKKGKEGGGGEERERERERREGRGGKHFS